jgi:hypothetical protein
MKTADMARIRGIGDDFMTSSSFVLFEGARPFGVISWPWKRVNPSTPWY